MISRSNSNEYIELEQIIRELNSSDIVFLSNGFGEYYAHRSRKRGPGKYSTIKFGTRWYMISVCGTLKPYHKLIMEDGPVVKPLDMSFKDWLERSAELRPKDG